MHSKKIKIIMEVRLLLILGLLCCQTNNVNATMNGSGSIWASGNSSSPHVFVSVQCLVRRVIVL